MEIELGSSQHEARVREKLYYLVSIVSLAYEPDLHWPEASRNISTTHWWDTRITRSPAPTTPPPPLPRSNILRKFSFKIYTLGGGRVMYLAQWDNTMVRPGLELKPLNQVSMTLFTRPPLHAKNMLRIMKSQLFTITISSIFYRNFKCTYISANSGSTKGLLINMKLH